jgi:protein-disulfide isomerase
MKKLSVLASVAILLLLFAQPGFSQKSKEMDTLKEDVKALKEGQQGIQKEIQEIKNQLKAKPAPAPAEFKETTVNVEGDPFKGNKDAKLAVIEFSDYQ